MMNQLRTNHEDTCQCRSVPATAISTFTAAEYGDLNVLRQRIDKATASFASRRNGRRDIFMDQNGYSLIHYAAQHDRVTAVRYLLGLCYDDRMEDLLDECRVQNGGCGATPLHRAAYSGAVGAMQVLLDTASRSGDSNRLLELLVLAKDESFGDDMTALHKAVSGGRYMAVHLILESVQRYSKRNISENGSLLRLILNARDRNGRNAMELCNEVLRRESEDAGANHQTNQFGVSRWDQTAGGVADWNKCRDLLSHASMYHFDLKADSLLFGSSSNYVTQCVEVNTVVKSLPEHLLKFNTCLDCSNSKLICQTMTWENAFRQRLKGSIDKKVNELSINVQSRSYQGESCQQNKGDSVQLSKSQAEARMNDQSQPSSLYKNNFSTQSKVGGRICSKCETKHIVLKRGLDGLLVCNSCFKSYPRFFSSSRR